MIFADTHINGEKLYQEYRDGTFQMSGNTSKKRKRTIQAIRTNTQKSVSTTVEEAVEVAKARRGKTCPIEGYLKPISDQETQTSFEEWRETLQQTRIQHEQRQARRAKATESLNAVPATLTFHGFWNHVKKYGTNPHIIPYLYCEQDKIGSIEYECCVKDSKTKVKQRQYMITWVDTYIHKAHIPLTAKHGYIAKDVQKCPMIKKLYGPIREPADTANIPASM